MRQIANNTFNSGMLMDMQPLTTPNTTLTDCLNGTLITYNGNEFVLQNDDGNGKVLSCSLPKDFIPIGLKEYGGIIYIVSQNPFTGDCEIGSFPSPESVILTDKDIAPVTEFKNKIFYNNSSDVNYQRTTGIQNDNVKLDFGTIKTGLLRPGDKFAIYLTNPDNPEQLDFLNNINYTNFEKLIETYNNGEVLERNLFKLKLVRIGDDGVTESIKEIVPVFKYGDTSKFYYNKSQILESNGAVNPEGLFAVYNNKINGYLAVIVEIEQVDEFNISIDPSSIISSVDGRTYNFNIEANSVVTKNCKNNVFGLQINSSTIDINGVETPKNTIEVELLSNQLTNWEKFGVGKTVPKENITLSHTKSGIDVNDNIKLSILPYSRFNYFNSLKYENTFNYNKLTSAQESNIWKYYYDKSIDTEIQPDKMMLTFDFFVRGTSNGRNKVDAMYIEFYDIVSDASMFYPLTSISDSKTISLNCFDGLKVTQTGNGGMSIGTDLVSNISTDCPYYILIDKNKSNTFNDITKKLVDGLEIPVYKEFEKMSNSPWDDVKNTPQVYKIESEFTNKRYNNLGDSLKTKYTKLRKDNFYIVKIVGLDFYKGSAEPKKYVVYNFMWTNGVFNKYWSLSGEESNDNFNLKKYPNFLNLNLLKISESPSNWIENLSTGDLIVNPDASQDNEENKNSFQSYTKPYFNFISNDDTYGKRFNTRINLNGSIENSYKINISIDKSNLNYGELESNYKSKVIFTKYPLYRPLNTTTGIIENNESYLPTNSKIEGVTISNKLGTINYDPLEEFIVKFDINSNRKIESSALKGDLEYPKLIYRSVFEAQNMDAINSNSVLNLRCRATVNNRYFYIDLLPDYKPTYTDSEIPSYPIADNSNASLSTVQSKIKELIGNDSIRFVHLNGQSDSDGYPAKWSYENYNANTKPTGAGSNYDEYVFILISSKRSINDTQYCYLPFKLSCLSSSQYNTLISELNNTFKSNFYFSILDSFATKSYNIPNIGGIQSHNSFSTNYSLTTPIIKATVSGMKISTLYKGSKTIMDQTLYTTLQDLIPSSTLVKNIGKVFNSTDNVINNFPTQDMDTTDITLKDSYILKSNKFILNKDNSKYTIENITEDLKNPQRVLSSNVEIPQVGIPNNLYIKLGEDNYKNSGFAIENGKFIISTPATFDSKNLIAMYDRRTDSNLCWSPTFSKITNLPIETINLLSRIGTASDSPFK